MNVPEPADAHKLHIRYVIGIALDDEKFLAAIEYVEAVADELASANPADTVPAFIAYRLMVTQAAVAVRELLQQGVGPQEIEDQLFLMAERRVQTSH